MRPIRTSRKYVICAFLDEKKNESHYYSKLTALEFEMTMSSRLATLCVQLQRVTLTTHIEHNRFDTLNMIDHTEHIKNALYVP
jgi:hypothetical protein